MIRSNQPSAAARKPRARKSGKPVTRWPAELSRHFGLCDCVAGEFQSRPWGTPSVQTTLSQGFTIITIKAPIRFQFTCKKGKPDSVCFASAAAQIVKADFGTRPVLSSHSSASAFNTGKCDGRARSARGTTKFIIVLDGEYKRFYGTVNLRFTLNRCGSAPPWNMTLVIRDKELDEGESDWDGDGRPNNEEPRAFEWVPDR